MAWNRSRAAFEITYQIGDIDTVENTAVVDIAGDIPGTAVAVTDIRRNKPALKVADTISDIDTV